MAKVKTREFKIDGCVKEAFRNLYRGSGVGRWMMVAAGQSGLVLDKEAQEARKIWRARHG